MERPTFEPGNFVYAMINGEAGKFKVMGVEIKTQYHVSGTSRRTETYTLKNVNETTCRFGIDGALLYGSLDELKNALFEGIE